MRTYTAHHVRYRAGRVQEWAFYSGVLLAIAFIGFAITSRATEALVCAILGALALGVSIGAWVVAMRFKD